MEIINVLVAAGVGWGIGAVYYGLVAEPWMEAANISRDANGKPEGGQSPVMFAVSFILILIVAGMMRHVFTLSGIDSIGAGVVGGLGVGLFFICPWIALNNMYGMRPRMLTLIDGGYAVLACGATGFVLTLF
ncbi:DUF1761 domain-containing protein [Rhodobacteraceae bacterium 63075]|nr:DUF1761 domain-containing protein [Rhodobacteraceae bacterium 63075]